MRAFYFTAYFIPKYHKRCLERKYNPYRAISALELRSGLTRKTF